MVQLYNGVNFCSVCSLLYLIVLINNIGKYNVYGWLFLFNKQIVS